MALNKRVSKVVAWVMFVLVGELTGDVFGVVGTEIKTDIEVFNNVLFKHSIDNTTDLF